MAAANATIHSCSGSLPAILGSLPSWHAKWNTRRDFIVSLYGCSLSSTVLEIVFTVDPADTPMYSIYRVLHRQMIEFHPRAKIHGWTLSLHADGRACEPAAALLHAVRVRCHVDMPSHTATSRRVQLQLSSRRSRRGSLTSLSHTIELAPRPLLGPRLVCLGTAVYGQRRHVESLSTQFLPLLQA